MNLIGEKMKSEKEIRKKLKECEELLRATKELKLSEASIYSEGYINALKWVLRK